MRLPSRAVLCLGVLSFATPGFAHDLSCRETFNGQRILIVDTYPLTVEVAVELINEHPTAVSDALSVTSALFPPGLFDTPTSVEVGGDVTKTFNLEIASYEACLALGSAPSIVPGVYLSTVTVTWDVGSAQCSAQIVCQPQVCR